MIHINVTPAEREELRGQLHSENERLRQAEKHVALAASAFIATANFDDGSALEALRARVVEWRRLLDVTCELAKKLAASYRPDGEAAS